MSCYDSYSPSSTSRFERVSVLSKSVEMVIRCGILTLLLLLCAPAYAKPIVQNGLLDLSEWDFERDGSVELNGKWEFF
jgi:hypothetical protein